MARIRQPLTTGMAAEAIKKRQRPITSNRPRREDLKRRIALMQAPEREETSLIGQALLRFAPIALGAAFGGAGGGAIGARAGEVGAQQLERAQRDIEAAEEKKQRSGLERLKFLADIEAQETSEKMQELERQERLEREARRETKEEEALKRQLSREAKKDKLAAQQLKFMNNIRGRELALKEEARKVKAGQAVAKKKISSDQRKAATFARRIEQSEIIFGELIGKGFDPTSTKVAAQRALPDIVGGLKPPEVRQQEQAERNFVNAVLRRESGAAIAESEFESAERQYFPRVGDDKQTLANKALNRQIALEGLKAEAGEAFEEIPSPETLALQQQRQQIQTGAAGLPQAQAAPMRKIIQGAVYERRPEGWVRIQ